MYPAHVGQNYNWAYSEGMHLTELNSEFTSQERREMLYAEWRRFVYPHIMIILNSNNIVSGGGGLWQCYYDFQLLL